MIKDRICQMMQVIETRGEGNGSGKVRGKGKGRERGRGRGERDAMIKSTFIYIISYPFKVACQNCLSGLPFRIASQHCLTRAVHSCLIRTS